MGGRLASGRFHDARLNDRATSAAAPLAWTSKSFMS